MNDPRSHQKERPPPCQVQPVEPESITYLTYRFSHADFDPKTVREATKASFKRYRAAPPEHVLPDELLFHADPNMLCYGNLLRLAQRYRDKDIFDMANAGRPLPVFRSVATVQARLRAAIRWAAERTGATLAEVDDWLWGERAKHNIFRRANRRRFADDVIPAVGEGDGDVELPVQQKRKRSADCDEETSPGLERPVQLPLEESSPPAAKRVRFAVRADNQVSVEEHQALDPPQVPITSALENLRLHAPNDRQAKVQRVQEHHLGDTRWEDGVEYVLIKTPPSRLALPKYTWTRKHLWSKEHAIGLDTVVRPTRTISSMDGYVATCSPPPGSNPDHLGPRSVDTALTRVDSPLAAHAAEEGGRRSENRHVSAAEADRHVLKTPPCGQDIYITDEFVNRFNGSGWVRETLGEDLSVFDELDSRE
ncbi:hypothetical protein BAUCODRAFT_574398 [Baudoinia panamericana UAMH 10762]|uniref:Uncharacterized protein n=1 Tax=Baudoinia panamericana (strain UAMH 10762) TaxID=717646 RepID=M2LUL6_BAUPA|nr:uncharacterized protein BAUCODRAFT_574398 [Baudoinia panamericana UAMH 10762]EMC98287.1 hypothetical protein BAUCODRAFT_574398 [Baudoinia panamericana UAMH 10762]